MRFWSIVALPLVAAAMFGGPSVVTAAACHIHVHLPSTGSGSGTANGNATGKDKDNGKGKDKTVLIDAGRTWSKIP